MRRTQSVVMMRCLTSSSAAMFRKTPSPLLQRLTSARRALRAPRTSSIMPLSTVVLTVSTLVQSCLTQAKSAGKTATSLPSPSSPDACGSLTSRNSRHRFTSSSAAPSLLRSLVRSCAPLIFARKSSAMQIARSSSAASFTRTVFSCCSSIMSVRRPPPAAKTVALFASFLRQALRRRPRPRQDTRLASQSAAFWTTALARCAVRAFLELSWCLSIKSSALRLGSSTASLGWPSQSTLNSLTTPPAL
mmetsp:Transcript_284/g.1164  ORF Transcript_284/g.1164 Transcript_284/m.1164 type:complete len:247 (+) Transcript_284:606-1346(+)